MRIRFGQVTLGMLVGLSLGSLLRRTAQGGFRQEAVQRTYRVWAPAYRLVNLYLFGQAPTLRRLAVERLRLQRGDHVLDLSCGTGANFPYLEEAVGPEGRLVGLDYSTEMLQQAERQVRREGWRNVALIQGDAAEMALDETFDGVLWVLAASVVPDYREALRRAVQHLKPEGWLVVADARLSDRWYGRPFNWFADLLGLGAAADIGRRTWELLPEHLGDVDYRELLLGFLYVARGCKGTADAQ